MVKDVKKLKSEDRIYTNKELTNVVKNILTMSGSRPSLQSKKRDGCTA